MVAADTEHRSAGQGTLRSPGPLAETPGTSLASSLGPRTPMPIIDCDVHPSIGDYTQLHPYMEETWARHVRKSGFGGPSSGIMRGQGGLYRTDVTPPGGGEPGSDPEFLKKQLMERYNVRYAILNGGHIL